MKVILKCLIEEWHKKRLKKRAKLKKVSEAEILRGILDEALAIE